MLLACSLASVTMTSCDESDNSIPDSDIPQPPATIEELQEAEWEKCTKKTFIAPDVFDAEAPDFEAVIHDRFTKLTGSLAEAEVAFVDQLWIAANEKAVNEFFDRGGLVIIMRPSMSIDECLDKIDNEAGSAPMFNDNLLWEELLFAFNKNDEAYTLYDQKEFNGVYTDEITPLSDDDLAAINAYEEAHPNDDEGNGQQYIYDNDYAHNYNYYQGRLDPFVEFVNSTKRITRGDNPDEMSLNMEQDGYWFQYDPSFEVNHIIEKDFAWNKHGSVSIKFWVQPIYLLSCNGENKSGDYYLVKSEVTPHLKSLWEVGSCAGGLFCMGRCRIYAYWLDQMDIQYELTGPNGEDMSSTVEYYKYPVPDTENSEGSQSNGFSWGLNGALSGEIGADGPKLGANVGFSLEWSSESSFNFKGLSYERNTATKAPLYHYFSNVILTDDDYEDNVKTNGNFPTITHSEFTAKSAWIWYVPRKKYGVDDNTKTQLKLNVKVKPVVASWYHWRGAVEYNSNKRTYNAFEKNEGWFAQTVVLPAPDRTPWGSVALKNAANITVANIKIYKQADFTEKGTEADVYATIPSSYNVNEVAKASLPEGTYAIVYQTIDANNNNKVTGNWKYENVEIKQGETPSTATTQISTVNAVKM